MSTTFNAGSKVLREFIKIEFPTPIHLIKPKRDYVIEHLTPGLLGNLAEFYTIVELERRNSLTLERSFPFRILNSLFHEVDVYRSYRIEPFGRILSSDMSWSINKFDNLPKLFPRLNSLGRPGYFEEYLIYAVWEACETIVDYIQNYRNTTKESVVNSLITIAKIVPGFRLWRIGKNPFYNSEKQVIEALELLGKIELREFPTVTILDSNVHVGESYLGGRVDLLCQDAVVEIKTGKDSKITDDFQQVLLYGYMARRRKLANVKYAYLIYPLANLFYTIDLSEILTPKKQKSLTKFIDKMQLSDTNYIR